MAGIPETSARPRKLDEPEWPLGLRHHRRHDDARHEEIVVPEADHFRIEVERFSRAIEENKPFVVTPDDSLANMAVIDALFAAAR